MTDQQLNGYFPISRVSRDIAYEDFYENYYLKEQPVIIEGIGNDWPAIKKWNSEYLLDALSSEPSAKYSRLWYWLDRGGLQQDYVTPDIVERLSESPRIFPRNDRHMRLWVQKKDHVTHWHYDNNMVNVFNIQITGSKDWLLVSPESPPVFYPYTNFVVIGPKDEAVCRNRIHTRFTLNSGDMLYMPHLWTHKVYARDDENTSLNWLLTSNESQVRTHALERELERYHLQLYLTNHKYAVVRNAFNRLYTSLPEYLRTKASLKDLMQTPYQVSPSKLVLRILKETSSLFYMLIYFRHLYKTNLKGEPVKPISSK